MMKISRPLYAGLHLGEMNAFLALEVATPEFQKPENSLTATSYSRNAFTKIISK